MKILITGHTGFKGSWLSTLLSLSGHELYGVSLPPVKDGIYQTAQISKLFNKSFFQDISDLDSLNKILMEIKPQQIYHLAAQPLVIDSYIDPVKTIYSNVIGTMNILESSRTLDSLDRICIVTTDKVYRNIGKLSGYSESDSLGGLDPYSVSKSMADQLTQAWIQSFDIPKTVIVRAGNVIGGGDRSSNRLLPDLVKSAINQVPLNIRNPQSIRPWQHVLDCLNGYLIAMNQIEKFNKNENLWNFGPDEEQMLNVEEICKLASQIWFDITKSKIEIIHENNFSFKESEVLTLDSRNAKTRLSWVNKLDYEKALELTLRWEYEVFKGVDPLAITQNQINNFLRL